MGGIPDGQCSLLAGMVERGRDHAFIKLLSWNKAYAQVLPERSPICSSTMNNVNGWCARKFWKASRKDKAFAMEFYTTEVRPQILSLSLSQFLLALNISTPRYLIPTNSVWAKRLQRNNGDSGALSSLAAIGVW